MHKFTVVKRLHKTRKDEFVDATSPQQNPNQTITDLNLGPSDPYIKNPIHSDFVYFGCKFGQLVSYCLSKKEVSCIYGKVMKNDVTYASVTNDKKYIFVSDQKGEMKQIHAESGKIIVDYGQVQQKYIKLQSPKTTSTSLQSMTNQGNRYNGR